MSGAAPHSATRVAARLANGFALDLVRLIGFGRDVMDGLILTAISQANVSQITRNAELQRLYATLDQPPPDELRRPVSISAIANSLRLPFETTRRRIGAMIEQGIVRQTPKGVVIPTAPMSSPLYRFAAEGHYNLVRRLYLRLRAVGLLDDMPQPSGAPLSPDAPPVRLVVRLSSDYLLRLADPISQQIGDVLTGLILMDVFQANVEHLADSEGGSTEPTWTPADFVPDDQRRPVRPSTLGERLGIPQETVRRHLQRLVKADLCERMENGYVVTSRILARPGFVRFMLDNQSHLHRFFVALADFGVLSQWDAEDSALRGAA